MGWAFIADAEYWYVASSWIRFSVQLKIYSVYYRTYYVSNSYTANSHINLTAWQSFFYDNGISIVLSDIVLSTSI